MAKETQEKTLIELAETVSKYHIGCGLPIECLSKCNVCAAEAIYELGYRKPPEGEPPLLTSEDGHELRRNSEEVLVGDTCEDSFDYGFGEGAKAQLQSDIKWFRREECQR